MKTNIKGIKIFKSKIFYDNRGSFKEVYKKNLLPNKKLIFDCMSNSKKNSVFGTENFICYRGNKIGRKKSNPNYAK